MSEILRFTWVVSYETATIRRGTASTEQEAQRAAVVAHDTLVCQGLDPDKLAYSVN